MHLMKALLFAFSLVYVRAQTPVIGGSCKVGTADVQIGGKQTQFFLKCEATSESADGEGVWVVKSRAAASPATPTTSQLPPENTQPQQHPKIMRKHNNPNICEQDNGAREADSCTVSATCLQANLDQPTTFLQCEQSGQRWVKKSCQEGYIFNFEQQACIVPKRLHSLSHSCDPSATCTDKSDCPTSFDCQKGCCQLAICPNNRPVSNGCRHQYHCKAREECIYGGCCDRNRFNATTTISTPRDAEVANSQLFAYENSIMGVSESAKNFGLQTTMTTTHASFPEPYTMQLQTYAPQENNEVSGYGGSYDKAAVNTPEIASGYDNAVVENKVATEDNEKPSTFKLKPTPSKGKLDKLNKADLMIDEQQGCEYDGTFQGMCSLENPCSEESECREGRCCILMKSRCKSTLMPLAFPIECMSSDDCPIAAKCEDRRCCPLTSEETTAAILGEVETNDITELAEIVTPSVNICPSGEIAAGGCTQHEECDTGFSCTKNLCCQTKSSVPKTLTNQQMRCLVSPRCNATSLCPPRFTCSLEGKCCRVEAFCPDGTVPESLCSTDVICPSAIHKCSSLSNAVQACCVDGQQAAGLVCTFSSCSNSNPCNSGTCNNGYCCSSGSNSNSQTQYISPTARVKRASSASTVDKEAQFLRRQHDWPVGPPGVGFPDDLTKLDSVLIKATGDGSRCAGGFQSPIACGVGLEACPVGLHCDERLSICCPLLLPLTDRRNPTKPTNALTSSPYDNVEMEEHEVLNPAVLVPGNQHGSAAEFRVEPESGPIRFSRRSPQRVDDMASPQTNNCVGCGAAAAPQIITIPKCNDGCPRGYSGCCATTRASCCMRQQCPSGTQPTGQRCSPDCPTMGQLCVSGICCSSTGTTTLSAPAQSSCPGGGMSYGTCSSGYCATGYQCVQGSCCPSYQQPQPSISVYTCPGGGNSVGSCNSGTCATGYSCSSQNTCCPTTNPFVCPDGTQAAGGCVNGQCGSGYSCSNGLCCAATSSSPKCLDGSPAVGACIPSCTGDSCGRMSLTYYCGAGYTCTTGNICCPVNSCPDGGEPIGPTVNGLCPTGYSAQGTQCCSIVNTCLDGETSIGEPINGLCPTGYTLRGNACCGGGASAIFAAACIAEVQLGPCINSVVGDTCGGRNGYACNTGATGAATGELTCCPTVDYTTDANIIGPAILSPDGVTYECPIDYTAVMVNGEMQCVALASTPGVCDTAVQSGPCIGDTCPGGDVCNVYAQVCCPATTMSRLRNTRPKQPSQSIFSSRPRQSALTAGRAMCPNGDMPASHCMNDLCGAGLECVDNICCPIEHPTLVHGNNNNMNNFNVFPPTTDRPKRLCPNGEEALSTCFPDGTCGEGLLCLQGNCCGTPTFRGSMRPVQQPNKAIGSPCTGSQQCAGFTEGLSKCEQRVCRCTSIAYAKGIACVRRKMLLMNDQPMPVESSADSNSILPSS